jgi:hypothetical protein
MTLFIDHPGLALIPVCVLVALWSRSRSRVTLAAAVLWAVYFGWEIFVSEDRPDANIRIDLLAIYPILVVITVWGIRAGRRARGTRVRAGR